MEILGNAMLFGGLLGIAMIWTWLDSKLDDWKLRQKAKVLKSLKF